MTLEAEFNQYAEKVRSLKEATNEDLLVLYGLYKQATVGDVNTGCPSIFYQKDRAKWNSWNGCKGKSKEEAMTDYVTKAKQMLEAAGLA
ncbi:hypothetical protein vseg_016618 [Gypsophila vaccaria]